MSRTATRIHIFARARLFAEGLRACLHDRDDCTVTGAGPLDTESLRECRELAPDVVLLDVAHPDAEVWVGTAGAAVPDAAVVALTESDSDEELVRWVQTGAVAVVSRDADASALLATLKQAVRGELICRPSAAGLLARRVRSLACAAPADSGLTVLTGREREVLRCIALGMSNKAIAKELHIGLSTVKNHVHSVLDKLSVSCRSDAAAYLRKQEPRIGFVA